MRPSLIPGAGNGLFTTVPLKKGVTLQNCTYGGDVHTFVEARRGSVDRSNRSSSLSRCLFSFFADLVVLHSSSRE